MKTRRIGVGDSKESATAVNPALSHAVPLCADRTTFRFTPEEHEECLTLFRAAHLGDRAAFDRLATGLRPLTWAVVGRWIHAPEDREDAVQDVWLSLWLWMQRCEKEVSVSAVAFIAIYAKQIAQNIITARRALKRGGRHPAIHEADIRAHLYGLHGHRHGRTALDHVERAPDGDPLRKMGIVHRLVTKLPAEHLATLNRFFFDCRTVEEIAEERAAKKADVHRLLAGGIEIIRHFADKLGEIEGEEACA